jgi:hypothetical protein
MEQFDGGMPGNSVAKEIKDEIVDVIQNHADETAELLETYGDDGLRLIELYKDDAYNFVKRAEKLGKNPLDILTNPPLDGQTLEGWLLDIDDLANPVNLPLKFNYDYEEIETIRKELIANPDSKLFSIGYGRDAKIPFDKMANNFEGHPMTFLSVPETRWEVFSKEKAYGDFWAINTDAIEWGIEERKIFVLNVNYKNASDELNPLATRRFTFAELKIIERPKNNYTLIANGEYSFFVPNELLDTYKSYLPSELLNP